MSGGVYAPWWRDRPSGWACAADRAGSGVLTASLVGVAPGGIDEKLLGVHVAPVDVHENLVGVHVEAMDVQKTKDQVLSRHIVAEKQSGSLNLKSK